MGIGGFGNSGVPLDLIDATLIDHAPHELTIVSNNAGGGEVGLARLLQAGLAPASWSARFHGQPIPICV